MYLRSSFPPQRAGINRIELIVVVNLIGLATLLLIPACNNTRTPATRTQSVHDLKFIGIAMQSFYDGNKRLLFNGCDQNPSKDGAPKYSAVARSDDPRSGSWLFQILPYIDQQAMFHLNGNSNTTGFTNVGIQAYLCPGRGRPVCEHNQGPWSDYFINNYLNDAANADKPDNPDGRMTMVKITDGTSNTIFAGHGNIARPDYAKSQGVPGCSNIFVGGTQGTMRGGPKWVKGTAPIVALQQDSQTPALLAAGGWGGPYPQGALMVWVDGTVRMVPYTTAANVFGAYLTPEGNEDVTLPG